MASPEELAKVPDMCAELNRKFGGIPWNVMEFFMLTNSHIWRPVKGYCFETWFEKVMIGAGKKIEYAGGDNMTDMYLHNDGKKIGLQLKTPSANRTRANKTISYELHKTHGKERMPYNLYKRVDFPEFMIGLHPDGFFICKNKDLESHKKYPECLKPSPVFDWNEHLNKYEKLGLPNNIRLPHFGWNNKEFPIIGHETKLSDYDILVTLNRKENFRLLEQNLAGSIREWHFRKIAMDHNTIMREAKGKKEIKIDFVSPNGKKIQVKGITKSITDKKGMPCVEVKGSHGRVPERLYRKKSFDFLVVVFDSFKIPKEYLPKDVNEENYNCVIIPEWYLPLHKRSKEWGAEYYKDIFCFEFDEYALNDFNLLKPCMCYLE